MEPEQSGFHWQANIYFQFYILILGSVEVPYGVHLPPLSQIKSFPPVLPILKFMVKINGEEMPGDVESIGAEGGVADMDEIEEIRQLTLLLYVEQDTGIAEVTNDLCKL